MTDSSSASSLLAAKPAASYGSGSISGDFTEEEVGSHRAVAKPRGIRPSPHPAEPRAYRRTPAISSKMLHALSVIERLAPAEVTVTLMGQTGTGKDVLARHLHQNSRRVRGPFVVFDCGSVAASLAESELLGHERGAFTGAASAHTGAFERAHSGTLFLDEIGELPLDLQTRLLRVLESRSVRRVGGTIDRLVDVRVVAATNRDLVAEVAAGRFRQDLFFRLAAAVVQVPPLHERRDDIPLLVNRLLEDLGHPGVRLSDEAIGELQARDWPGNVRELKNTLACALAFVESDLIEPRHLSSSCNRPSDAPLAGTSLCGLTLEAIEREAIAQTLRHTKGNKSQAAQMLGIAVSTLYEKFKKYRLNGNCFPRDAS